jgi:hypothetical protein
VSDLLNAILSHISIYDKEDIQSMIDRKQGIEDLIIEYVREEKTFTNYDLFSLSSTDKKHIFNLLDKKFRHYFNEPFIDKF